MNKIINLHQELEFRREKTQNNLFMICNSPAQEDKEKDGDDDIQILMKKIFNYYQYMDAYMIFYVC